MNQNEVLQKVDELIEKVDTLLKTLKSNARDSSEWVDKQETMKILKCSERTLQTLRDNKLLPFSPSFGGSKFFYKKSDILTLLESGYPGRKSGRIRKA